MKQYLEQRMYESTQIPKENLRIYQVGDLEGLSASALYTDKLPKFSAGGFDLPKFDPLPAVGTSFFGVQIPESNAIDRSLKISTPDLGLIINQTQRIKGLSGIDYFNRDGSSAGRIFGLTKPELDSLED